MPKQLERLDFATENVPMIEQFRTESDSTWTRRDVSNDRPLVYWQIVQSPYHDPQDEVAYQNGLFFERWQQYHSNGRIDDLAFSQHQKTRAALKTWRNRGGSTLGALRIAPNKPLVRAYEYIKQAHRNLGKPLIPNPDAFVLAPPVALSRRAAEFVQRATHYTLTPHFQELGNLVTQAEGAHRKRVDLTFWLAVWDKINWKFERFSKIGSDLGMTIVHFTHHAAEVQDGISDLIGEYAYQQPEDGFVRIHPPPKIRENDDTLIRTVVEPGGQLRDIIYHLASFLAQVNQVIHRDHQRISIAYGTQIGTRDWSGSRESDIAYEPVIDVFISLGGITLPDRMLTKFGLLDGPMAGSPDFLPDALMFRWLTKNDCDITYGNYRADLDHGFYVHVRLPALASQLKSIQALG
ncbi:hypothetical protein HY408_01150 [Candidatus Gottesmanbacteria bacterium]|nr:hypothetical protein [Candidatus Gottesmanbacteria bacterium]